MNLLSKLLGRKPETSANLAAESEARTVALAKAEATVAEAARDRVAALEDLDPAGIARADAIAAEAKIAVEVGTRALDVLMAAHAARVEVEQKAAQDQRAAELIAEGKAIAAEFSAEWDRSANALARLRRRAGLHDLAIDDALFVGAIAPGAVPHAEAFRGANVFDNSMPAIIALDGSTLWPAPLPEAERARAKREADEEYGRRQEARRTKEAERRQAWLEAEGARRQAERETEDAKARGRARDPYFPSRRAMSDAAR